MSDFIVSARKYRPATFQSVVGQKHNITIMITATQHEMLHPCIFRPGTYI